MLTSQVFEVLLLVLISVTHGSVLKKELIHHYMDESELQYYFGTESKLHVPHYELVKIGARERSPNENPSDDIVHLNVKAFDDEIFLKLKVNKNLVSPFMRFVEKSDETGETELLGRSNQCHYLHIDDETSAAISGCNSQDIVRTIFEIISAMINERNIFRTELSYDHQSPTK